MKSKSNHRLAQLRMVIGLTQPELASLVGVTLSSIKSIETGRLKLSGRLAARVSSETGVSYGWLIGHLSEMTAMDWSIDYTRETYQAHRAAIEKAQSKGNLPKELKRTLADARKAVETAGDPWLALFRLREAVKTI